MFTSTTILIALISGLSGLAVLVLFIKPLLGLVIINEKEVGIVVKKFGPRLAAGQLVALNGEAGYQADTLAPGWHFFYFPWQYAVRKTPVIIIPQGQIGLLVAAAGASIPPERILGKMVECDNFQDTRKFLLNEGEKGRQLGILTAGTYRINKALFTVINAQNAHVHEMAADQLHVYSVAPDQVGIVTTLDGRSIDDGEIAGAVVDGHDNYQKRAALSQQ